VLQWYTPIIPALGRLRQEDCEFQSGLHSNTLTLKALHLSPHPKKKKKKEKEKKRQ
jgi:hypothetical protein